ncbi:aminoacyl-tRNA hydrolase [Candidatus Roizmanbacteria bacterium RIFCSPLOWO2_01_FULL_41_22]|uniref:Peptidyl-tRNA hydrolase n=1 Tax=Candidatus Roizmanbacteria bacterium RIFCSPLOWO2_01_FULL_41_22 TaxID=1802067 RepID=A0A1F7J7U9_9BACT|nr:MAG: aminoacyl-tRNA hydrolase [Candidatus Roizmanbacteria bacterium RIFCSPLOWO2_01_FULL_41_22]
MTKIFIIGLGNPGPQYQNNRHNVGFMFVDFLLEKLKAPDSSKNIGQSWKYDKYSDSEIAKIDLNVTCYKLHVTLVKPQTFMNRSGFSVKKLTTYYSLLTTNLYVVHDDLDIPLGKFKIQAGVGPKVHNGLDSIEKALGTKDFWRIRIGVDNRGALNRQAGEQYVLSNFIKEETTELNSIFETIHHQLFSQVIKL